jgi:hypothetical protein
MKSKKVMRLILAVGLALSGCVSIPRESVELSQALGKGLAEAQRRHIALLNVYFANKKQQVDHWIQKEYLPRYIQTIQSELKKAGRSPVLSPQQIADLLQDAMTERDQKQTDLEQTRILLLTRVNDYYATLYQSNASVTSLLQSAIKSKDATSTTIQSIKTLSNGALDLEQIDKKVDGYLKQVGAAASAESSLYTMVKGMEREESTP